MFANAAGQANLVNAEALGRLLERRRLEHMQLPSRISAQDTSAFTIARGTSARRGLALGGSSGPGPAQGSTPNQTTQALASAGVQGRGALGEVLSSDLFGRAGRAIWVEARVPARHAG